MNQINCLAIEYFGTSGLINTFYLVGCDALEIFEQWYSELDCVLLDSGLELNKQNLKYKIITPSDSNFSIVEDFIQTFGSPWEILEQIDGLEQMFESENELELKSNSSSDSDLYTQTETIGQIISAHIDGNIQKVKELLGSTNVSKIDDEVISNIKKKYV